METKHTTEDAATTTERAGQRASEPGEAPPLEWIKWHDEADRATGQLGLNAPGGES